MDEWLSVLVMATFWGGSMAWMNASRSSVGKTVKGRVLFALEWIFPGLLFGILTTFRFSQAIHLPLVIPTLMAVAGMFITTLIRGKKTLN